MTGATTPEELDALLEDAFVLGDRRDVRELFEPGAVLAFGDAQEARGATAIGRAAADLWRHGHTYLSDPRRVLQARELALLVSPAGVHVAHRGRRGTWRLAIALLDTHATQPGRIHEQ